MNTRVTASSPGEATASFSLQPGMLEADLTIFWLLFAAALVFFQQVTLLDQLFLRRSVCWGVGVAPFSLCVSTMAQFNAIGNELPRGVRQCMMQCGFALLEAGSVRIKNTKNILLKNVVNTCLSALTWWAIGKSSVYCTSSSCLSSASWLFCISCCGEYMSLHGTTLHAQLKGGEWHLDRIVWPRDNMTCTT